MTIPSIGASSSPASSASDGIGVPRSSGRISPRSEPASGGVAPASSASADTSSEGNVAGA